jgi:hypothetical protein
MKIIYECHFRCFTLLFCFFGDFAIDARVDFFFGIFTVGIDTLVRLFSLSLELRSIDTVGLTIK